MKKKSNWLLITLLLAGLALLAACGGADQTDQDQPAATSEADGTAVQPSVEGEVKTLYVGSELVDCVGVAPQKCMQVRENPADAYTLFYQQITGFTFEPGYEYELLVTVTTIENPPADGSSLQYTLVNIVSQTPVGTTQTVVTGDATGDALPLVGALWQLQSLQGAAVVADTAVTAVFAADGSLGGSAGCNNYFTSYQVDGQTITIDPQIGSTMMACADPVMQQETAYLAALSTATAWQISGSTLTLTDAAGAPLAVFTAVIPTSLTGTTWQLTGFNNGQDAVVSPVAGSTITAVFGEDGALSGSAGCNNYNTSFTTDGGSISIAGSIATTTILCAEDLMQQETAYLAALPVATTYAIQGDSLELRNANGALIASYSAAAPESDASLVGVWQLTDYSDAPGSVVAVPDGAKITAVFGEDGTLSGNAGCNNYTTSFTVSGSSLTFNSAIASTMMMCDEAAMQREMAYLAALTNTVTFALEGDALKLLDANGGIVAAFTSVAPTPLTGTNWQMTGYNNGLGGVVSPVAGTQVTAVFADDGTLAGSAGCNNYTTSFTVDSGSISINPNIASTMIACAEDVMQQETAFLAALPNAATYAIQGDVLELRDASGALMASFTVAQAADLVGPVWTVTLFNNGLQAAVGLLDGTEITMSFGEDGNVQGSAGCNQYFGPYTVNGDALSVGLLATTRAYCPEPEGKMQQEAQFLAALQMAASFTIQNGQLDIRMVDGAIAALAAAQ
ncbi:MAG: META domain-containing protein [Chloroflexi bacterium]|nr:META domain-containing protein [Chloroflexota bacterium]